MGGQAIVLIGLAAFVACGFTGDGKAYHKGDDKVSGAALVAILLLVGYLIGLGYHVFPAPTPLLSSGR